MEKARLSVMYKETVVPALIKEFGYKNVNEVPIRKNRSKHGAWFG